MKNTRVAGVVPVYEPAEATLQNIELLSRQVDAVYVINDGPTRLDHSFISTLIRNNIIVVDPGSNRGIAAALNDGFRRALNDDNDLLFCMDQDTELPSDFVATLRAHLLRTPGDSSVAGCAPELVQGARYECTHPFEEGSCSVETIQSGMLLRGAYIEAIGFLDESLFIDGVDTDLMLRFHSRDLHVLLVPGLLFNHAIGAPSRRTVLCKAVRTDNHSASRRYYMTRNKIHLTRRYGRAERNWARVVRRRLLRQSIIAVVLEKDRCRKARAIVLGALHGVSGKLGPR